MEYINLFYTIKSWEFGIGFHFPSKSKKFFMGTKLRTSFHITIYIGPFTLDIGKEEEIVEYYMVKLYYHPNIGYLCGTCGNMMNPDSSYNIIKPEKDKLYTPKFYCCNKSCGQFQKIITIQPLFVEIEQLLDTEKFDDKYYQGD